MDVSTYEISIEGCLVHKIVRLGTDRCSVVVSEVQRSLAPSFAFLDEDDEVVVEVGTILTVVVVVGHRRSRQRCWRIHQKIRGGCSSFRRWCWQCLGVRKRTR